VSGSGSIKIAAETIGQIYNGKKLIYISNPSWAYHAPIFEQSGVQTQYYRYYGEKVERSKERKERIKYK
jgi:aspartate/tyrosine/aromatic aminotransferase